MHLYIEDFTILCCPTGMILTVTKLNVRIRSISLSAAGHSSAVVLASSAQQASAGSNPSKSTQVLFLPGNTKKPPYGGVSLMLPDRDSNPD